MKLCNVIILAPMVSVILACLILKFRRLRTTPISGKRCRSEKAILGALGEFRGILGAALGIQELHSRNAKFHSRNGISRLEQYEKPQILGATPGAIPGIDWNPNERFSFAPSFSERFFFQNWGGPRAPEYSTIKSQFMQRK